MAGYFGDLQGAASLIDDDMCKREEALIRADVGVTVTTKILDDLRLRVKEASVAPRQLSCSTSSRPT